MAKAKIKTTAAKTGLSAATVKDALATVTALEANLDTFGLASLTDEERLHSNGRIREGEDAAILAILDTIDASPATFQALAPHDHGDDPKVVETAPARTAIERRELLLPLRDRLAALVQRLSDDLLSSGALARDVSVPAYAILQANAAFDPNLRKKGATAISYYGKAPKKAAATRAKKK